MSRFLGRLVLFGAVCLIVVELFFRFVLAACQWPEARMTGNRIRTYDPDGITSGRYTYGRYCRGGYVWSINNAGWNSEFDYRQADARNGKPMIAILGDSYIEGFYSDVDTHIDSFLAELFADTVDFYAFGMSGAFLSQYIAMINYEIAPYRPAGYLIFLNSSDVSKSFTEAEGHSYYYQYAADQDRGYVELPPPVLQQSQVKRTMLRSSFVRYLRSNAKVLLGGGGMADENAGSAEPDISSSNAVPSSMVDQADFLLCLLDSLDVPVLLVSDCPRAWIYSGREEEQFEDVRAIASRIDLHENVFMIELKDCYVSNYAADGHEFSVDGNPHWDSYSNRVIAEFIKEELEENSFYGMDI